jgi:hypothetical protein
MGVTKGRVSQIEQGKVSGQDVVARFAAALGGRLHQAIARRSADSTRHHRDTARGNTASTHSRHMPIPRYDATAARSATGSPMTS